jgi:hypothetical protein
MRRKLFKVAAPAGSGDWCRTTFGKQVKGGYWWRHRGSIYFTDEQMYALYLLRFSNG